MSVPPRIEAPSQRTPTEAAAGNGSHGPAGTQTPSPARISQVNTQRVQSRVNGGSLQRIEQSESVTGQTIRNTASFTTQKPPSAAAGSTPAAPAGGRSTSPQPAQTRYTQRPAQAAPKAPTQGTAAKQTAIHAEKSHPGPAGTPPSSPALSSAVEPRPGRNAPPSGTAPSVQARQHEPVRQERRPAGGSSAPVPRGTASIPHPSPAGNVEKGRDKTAARRAAGASALTPKADPTHGIARTPSATAIKGNGKKNESAAPARKQRGKKHGGEG